MFTTLRTRGLILAFVLPILAIPAIARAESDERIKLLEAIEAVKARIETTAHMIEKIEVQLEKLDADMLFYKEMYAKTKDDAYLKAYEEAGRIYDRLSARADMLKIDLDGYYTLLAELEDKLAQLKD